MKWVPNALTIGRCICAALVLWGFWQAYLLNIELNAEASREAFETTAAYQQLWFQFAFLAFLAGALTDFLDGWTARRFNVQSRFGIWLDPIADKMLVAMAMLGLAVTLRTWLVYVPAALIIARDVFMTWFRTTPRGVKAVSPSVIAKWKTAVEMLAIIGLMLPFALWARPFETSLETAGTTALSYVLLAMLWLAAGLSWWTAWLYIRAVSPAD